MLNIDVFEPLGDRVLIKIDDTPDKSPGGIMLPERSREKPVTGIVVAVGKGTHQNGKLVKCQVEPHQRVMFSRYSGIPMPDNDGYILVKDAEIMGVLNTD